MAVSVATLGFDVDRVTPEGSRLLVTGRWSGVRGRRFVRPTLTCQTNDGSRRLLADLEHKPWAAQDGEPWQAAFPWEPDLELVGTAELSVAPDIIVAVDSGARPSRADRQRRRSVSSAQTAALRERAQQLERALEAERTRHEDARREAEEAARQRVQADAALARRDSALDRLERTEAELAGLRAERDAAVHAQERSEAARTAAVERLRVMMTEHARAQHALDRVQDELERTRRELEAARRVAARRELSPTAAAPRPAASAPARRAVRWPRMPAGESHTTAISPLQRGAAVVMLVCVLIALGLILHVI